MRASFENPELVLVICSGAVFDLSEVHVTACVPIPSPTDLPLGSMVAPMIVALLKEKEFAD